MNLTRRDFLQRAALAVAGAVAMRVLGPAKVVKGTDATVEMSTDGGETWVDLSRYCTSVEIGDEPSAFRNALGIWTVVLSDAELEALSGGVSPLLVRPQALAWVSWEREAARRGYGHR